MGDTCCLCIHRLYSSVYTLRPFEIIKVATYWIVHGARHFDMSIRSNQYLIRVLFLLLSSEVYVLLDTSRCNLALLFTDTHIPYVHIS